MKILFIHSVDDIASPEKPLRSQGEMQFGISYLSSLLRQNGHETDLVIISRMLGKSNKKAVEEKISRFGPGLIAFDAVSTEYPFITEIAKSIKEKHPGIFTLIGGPHASLNPREALSGGFDGVCVGEGEYPTLDVVTALENKKPLSDIPNIWTKQGSKIRKNPARPFLEDLQRLPFPDREIWQEWINPDTDDEIPVLLARGCPFDCAYCCNHALKKLAAGKYVRFRPVTDILKEIKEVFKRFPGKTHFYLEVETIGANRKWLLELASALERFNAELKKPLSFRTNLRITPNMDLETMFGALKGANFDTLNIGLESGSERVRYDILKRNYSNEDIINAVKLARKYGLGVHLYNLIGVPGETLEDFAETIRINRMCRPDRTYPHIFFPYPGTELYEICKSRGLLPAEINTDLERCKATLDLPGFSKKDIQKSFVWFDYNVYKGRAPLGRILAKVLVSKLRSNTILHSVYRRLSFSPVFRYLRKSL